MRALMGLILLVTPACMSSPAGGERSGDRMLEQFMRDYAAAWNRHDADGIAREFYRTREAFADESARLAQGFEALRAQGYSHSDIIEVKACRMGPDEAWAGMRFVRLTAAGEPLGPPLRASAYTLRRFSDGWRIVRVGPGAASPETPLACPAP